MSADGEPGGDRVPVGERIDDATDADALSMALAAQVRMLWELELGDTPMALRFDPSAPRD